MFNGSIIPVLLQVQGKTEKDFAEYFWQGGHSNWSYLFNRKAVNSNTLERLSAYFHCPVDIFFLPIKTGKRPNLIESNDLSNSIGLEQYGLSCELAWLRNELTAKEEIIKQKDETIHALKEQIQLLSRYNLSGQDLDANISPLKES